MTGIVSSGGTRDPRPGSTYPWRRAKIEHDLTLLEEAILLVELDQLEGGTRTISLLLGELVPLVETALAVLLLDRHGTGCFVANDATPGVLAFWLDPPAVDGFPSSALALWKFLAEYLADKR